MRGAGAGDAGRNLLVADLGGSFLRMARTGDRTGDLGAIARIPTETRHLKRFLDQVAALAGDLAADLPQDAPLVIASAGLVEPAEGRVTAVNIPCLTGEPIARLLSERLGRPVAFLNDADAFVLAEAASGAAEGHAVVLGAILGTGVGGGLVVDGRVVEGPGGVAGEWGHGPVASRFPEAAGRFIPRFACGCGQTGCVDTFGGARGLERLHAVLGHGSATSPDIVRCWREGDFAAGQSVATWAEMVAEPLSMAVNLLGASVVVTGGGLGQNDDLVATLDREVRRRILRKSAEPIVVPGRMRDAALHGAAIVGRQMMDRR